MVEPHQFTVDVGQEGGHQTYVEAQKWGAFLVLNVYISQGGNKDDHRYLPCEYC